MFDLNPNQLTYVKKGTLYLEKKPFYIVELIKEQNLSYVTVYRVHPNTDNNPKKLAQEVSTKTGVFSSHTRLGQIANALIPTKVTKKWVVKDPVFVAPIIPKHINTFTGREESGFFEREEDTVTVQAGQRKLVRGKNTGVFIGLSSIVWEDKISIPTQSLLEALSMYQGSDFFDLSGNNNNDKGNPLSSYYEEQ